jgi:tetratricopeptide (TPR) repeat protein
MALYWQVTAYDYINFDDPEYVANNVVVKQGLSKETIAWAFKTHKTANWHPLTWISYLLDVHFFGSTPGVHHLINLFLHATNAVLLFIVFRRMTAGTWPSAIISALFAIHPLHVESVVWVSERKDVLSTLFWILTMWCYTGYTTHKDIKRYLAALLLFSLGLMAKPMLVTLPCILLLLDYWPLDRLRFFSEKTDRNKTSLSSIFPLIWEKIPFFVITTASSIVTFMAQKSEGAVKSLDFIAFNLRLANALNSYISYLKKIIWPYPLAVFYPYPSYYPWWKTIGSLLLLIAMFYLAFRNMKRHPYLLVGWLWYVGSLVPVIGIVQVGSQAMADRYTYVPAIGIFVIFVWGANELIRQWRIQKAGIVIGTLLLLAVLVAATWVQTTHWKDSITLFRHAIDVTTDNYLAHSNLAGTYAQNRQFDKAIGHYTEALRAKPDDAMAHNNLGLALAHKGRYADAVQHYSEALRLNPDYAEVHNNLGIALAKQGSWNEAIKHYRKAIQLRPHYAEAHTNLATVLVKEGRMDEAISHYSEAVDSDPYLETAIILLALALSQQGQIDEAVLTLEKGLKRIPNSADLNNHLGMLHHVSGNLDTAVIFYRKAISLQSDHGEALNNLAAALVHKKEYEEALTICKKLVTLHPDRPETYYNVASVYALQRQIEKSIEWLRKAIERGYSNWEMIKTDQDLENIRHTKGYQALIRNR